MSDTTGASGSTNPGGMPSGFFRRGASSAKARLAHRLAFPHQSGMHRDAVFGVDAEEEWRAARAHFDAFYCRGKTEPRDGAVEPRDGANARKSRPSARL